MKRTPEDSVFAVAFGRELKHHYERETTRGNPSLSDEQFAATLDVSRAALKKYLDGTAMPTVRVIVLAHLRYGIRMSYLGTSLFGKARRAPKSQIQTQLLFPFSVQSFTSNVHAKVESKGDNQFQLRVDVGT